MAVEAEDSTVSTELAAVSNTEVSMAVRDKASGASRVLMEHLLREATMVPSRPTRTASRPSSKPRMVVITVPPLPLLPTLTQQLTEVQQQLLKQLLRRPHLSQPPLTPPRTTTISGSTARTTVKRPRGSFTAPGPHLPAPLLLLALSWPLRRWRQPTLRPPREPPLTLVLLKPPLLLRLARTVRPPPLPLPLLLPRRRALRPPRKVLLLHRLRKSLILKLRRPRGKRTRNSTRNGTRRTEKLPVPIRTLLSSKSTKREKVENLRMDPTDE
mmetsp:Transcript_33738/g.57898  ORF Transcript_33738/g.57898 Transcript_33738/m.57898 type:complete len:270 (-) Transcript_33738:225-1034(-)